MSPRWFASTTATLLALSIAAAAAQTASSANKALPPAPLAGANSFTEGQVRTRLEALGYTAITSLAKDNNGIWQCSANKDGKSVHIAVDFKGNVVAN